MWVRIHRAVAIVLVIPLAVWALTGLLFHLKPGWGRAYDQLDIARSKVETIYTAVGPLRRDDNGIGHALSLDDARALVADAVSRSAHRDEYGAMGSASIVGDVVRVEYEHAVVEIGRNDARISQRGADTDRIDWLYRVHYLQWTGNTAIDRVLALFGLAAIWFVAVPGIVLFFRRRR